MCEVTRKNFEEKYPQIIDNLHSASFISIDCEFSGMFDDVNKCSLFDTPKERHKKLQKSLENYLIIQLGLTTFEYDRMKNTFIATSYTFYLTPSSLLKSQSNFMCQVGSLEFLRKQKFDFNKLFDGGLNYLNKNEETEVMRMMQDGSLLDENLEMLEYYSTIGEWGEKAEVGNEMLLSTETERGYFPYILQQEIRRRFRNIWTYDSPGGIKIRKVSESERRNLQADKEEEIRLKKKILDSLLGFSRIMKEIENLKKPVVGHNFLIDLMMIYKQFYNPAPVSYGEFKRGINRIFPTVFDTKNISFTLRKILSRETTWTSNALPDLYHYLKDGRGCTVVLFTPIIHHRDEEFLKREPFHDAGFDSYCTGFCFVKMSHMYSQWDAEKKVFATTSLPPTSSWLLGAVVPFKNRLNVTRGQVNHIALDGPDPRSIRPGLLYIRTRDNKPLDVSKLSEVLAKHASVDIRLLGRTTGLMAVSSHRQVEEILERFDKNERFQVTSYSFLQHSVLGRMVVAGAVIASTLAFFFVWKSSRTFTRVRVK